MKSKVFTVVLLSVNLIFAGPGPVESIVECRAYYKANDQSPISASVKVRSFTINSTKESAAIGDETCAIVGKFRFLLDPSNHGIFISVADISNNYGQIDRFACTNRNNPPMSIGLPYYRPIVAALYQGLPKDTKVRAISSHGFTGLQYVTGRDGQSQLQYTCN
ncbi:MAG: hypothetical protein JNM24_19210 [Bdellovibrionaceae bacterium]|nr:hypothetical protein [Pseudobdellovibrionaceae bacterium]